MAGEVEDRIGMQAEYLPTGSISFGRFESESLSWEKRSSFSHNRYLEEVEKFSTPGSVTQKKAYFEAHFKKRGLLGQSSSVSQTGSDGCINGDHGSFSDGYDSRLDGDAEGDELWRSRGNGWVEEEDSPLVEEEVAVVRENCDGDGKVFSSECLGGELLVCHEKSEGSVTQMADCVVEERCCSVEDQISLTLVDSQVPMEQELTRILQQDLGKEEPPRVDSQIGTADLSCRAVSQKSTRKGKPSMEQRTGRLNQKSQTSNNVKRPQIHPAGRLVKDHLKPGFSGSPRTKQERKPPSIMPSATPSMSRFMKSEDSKNIKERRSLLTRSENDLMTQKGATTPRLIAGVKASTLATSSRRPEKIISSRTVLRTGGGVISRSNENDATRKEKIALKTNDSGNSMRSTARSSRETVFSKTSVHCQTPSRTMVPANGRSGGKTTTPLSKSATSITLPDPKLGSRLAPPTTPALRPPSPMSKPCSTTMAHRLSSPMAKPGSTTISHRAPSPMTKPTNHRPPSPMPKPGFRSDKRTTTISNLTARVVEKDGRCVTKTNVQRP